MHALYMQRAGIRALEHADMYVGQVSPSEFVVMMSSFMDGVPIDQRAKGLKMMKVAALRLARRA